MSGNKGMGRDTVRGHQGKLRQEIPPQFDEDDLADEAHGHNKLQGNDQGKVRNQRQSWPDGG